MLYNTNVEQSSSVVRRRVSRSSYKFVHRTVGLVLYSQNMSGTVLQLLLSLRHPSNSIITLTQAQVCHGLPLTHVHHFTLTCHMGSQTTLLHLRISHIHCLLQMHWQTCITLCRPLIHQLQQALHRQIHLPTSLLWLSIILLQLLLRENAKTRLRQDPNPARRNTRTTTRLQTFKQQLYAALAH